MTGAEHLQRCREVALFRVSAGDIVAAFGGLMCDLPRHPATARLLTEQTQVALACAALAKDAVAFIDVVEGLAVPEGRAGAT